MNFDIYLISGTPWSWIQFPSHSEHPFFDPDYQPSHAHPELLIFRSGNMMYYTFLHPLAEPGSFGITVAVNSVMVQDIASLSRAFVRAWQYLADARAFVVRNADGSFRLCSHDWTKEQFLIEIFSRWFSNNLSALSFKALPPLSTDAETGLVKRITFSDSDEFKQQLSEAENKQITTVISYAEKARPASEAQPTSEKAPSTKVASSNASSSKLASTQKKRDKGDYDAKVDFIIALIGTVIMTGALIALWIYELL